MNNLEQQILLHKEMMNSPLVSIVMPAYNVEKYIGDAIGSVMKQTYQNWELLVVDDCSSDTTKNIIETFQKSDKRIQPIFLDKNGGKPSIAKNVALQKVKGKYIAFLDSDDMWLEEKLQKQVSFMEENKNYALTYTGSYWIDDGGCEIKKILPQYKSGYLLQRMLSRYEINNQSVMLKKEVLNNTLVKFNEKITIGEDYNLFMHIVAKYEVASIGEYLIKYRIHNNAITKSSKRVSDGVLLTLKELDKLYGIRRKYLFKYMLTYLKAIRFKYVSKSWK